MAFILYNIYNRRSVKFWYINYDFVDDRKLKVQLSFILKVNVLNKNSSKRVRG